jgi:hypothetical protein
MKVFLGYQPCDEFVSEAVSASIISERWDECRHVNLLMMTPETVSETLNIQFSLS